MRSAIFIGDFTRLEDILMSRTALVYGVAITGDAPARAARMRGGYTVRGRRRRTDDERRALARDELGTELVEAPDAATLARLVGDADLVAPGTRRARDARR